MSVDWITEFLPKLRCPHTHEALRLVDDGTAVVNASGTHRYPVVQGIPHLLPDSAIIAQCSTERGNGEPVRSE